MKLLLLGFGLAACLVLAFVDVQAWDEYDILQIDAMNDTTDVMDLKIKYKRINKTTFGLSGYVQFTDLTGVESELHIYYQAKPNSQFVLTPYKLPLSDICESLNRDYRKFLMNDLRGFSNFPYSDDPSEDLCPQFMNTKLELKNFVMHNSTIPESMELGTYKAQGYIFKDSVLVTGINFVISLY